MCSTAKSNDKIESFGTTPGNRATAKHPIPKIIEIIIDRCRRGIITIVSVTLAYRVVNIPRQYCDDVKGHTQILEQRNYLTHMMRSERPNLYTHILCFLFELWIN